MKMVSKSTVNRCSIEKLNTKFTTHFAARPAPPAHSLDLLITENLLPNLDHITILTSTPTLYEVQEQLEHLKNGRCAGVDGFSAEHLKYADSEVLDSYVHVLLERVWEFGEVPETWIESRLKPLFKEKGCQTNPDNYRALMVGAITNKVLILIMLDRMRVFYEASILPIQMGFRENKATGDAIFIARQIIAKHRGEIWGSFVDVKAAYDWVPRELLWRILKIRLGPENSKIIDVFENLYRKTTAKIDGSESIIDIFIGLRQGGPESCMLFNFWLDSVIRIVMYKCEQKYPGYGINHKYNISNDCTNRDQRASSGPQNGSNSTKFTQFADDLYVSAKSKDELQGVMTILNEVFCDFSIKLSESKTKTMTWNTTEDIKTSESLIHIDNKPIENVREFWYLGHLTTDEIKNQKFLQTQIGSAFGKWNEFKDIFLDHKINLKSRIMMAEAMVRARLVYSVQTERLCVLQRNTLDGIWSRMCRKMVKGGYQRVGSLPTATTTIPSTVGAVPESSSDNGGSQLEPEENLGYVYRFSNDNIHKICQSKNASTFCQIQHCKFLAHVARLPNDAIQKQWLFTDLPGNRCQWKPLARDLGIDEIQLRNSLFDKQKLNDLLYEFE